MSRSNIRPRPIDIFRKLPIIRDFKDEAKDLPFEDENRFMRTITLDDQGGAKQAEEKIEQKKPEKIFIPGVKHDDTAYAHQPEKYKRPSQYLKTNKPGEDFVEYDADSEDEVFLEEATKKSKKPMTLDRLEVIIDRLEHAARGGNLELDTALKLSFGRNREGPEIIQHIYEYWSKKRGKLANNAGKALLHRYRVLKNHDDPDVNAVFRPREREYVTRKKVRKNDKKSFHRMRELRLNFDRARTILELMKQREKLKKDRIQVVRAMFEVQCQMIQNQQQDPHQRPLKIPTAQDKPRSHHSMHSLKEKRRKQEDYGNPYEQTFNERHRKKPRGNNYNDRGEREDRLKLGQYSRYAAPQSEDALHPKSGGKLKPSKKKHFGGLKMSSSNRTQPVVRIIRQYANKDNAPVDYHSVQHTGVLLAPAAERDWRSYRYASKCRIVRGGRVIFDRNQVKDKVPMKIFYGVDHLDWDTTSIGELELRNEAFPSTCAQVLNRKRKYSASSVLAWGAKAAAKGEGESDNVVEVETAATAAPTTTA